MTRTRFLVLAALGLTLSLTGCSTTDDDSSPVSPTPSRSDAPQETTYGKCVDGTETILASSLQRGRSKTFPDCATVSIVGAAPRGSVIELGSVKLLVVEGDGITAAASSVERIIVVGNENDITHEGEATVDDQGSKNSITAK